MLEQFSRFGRELFLQGVNSSHSGNMSVRAGDRIFITRRGSMFANLKEGGIIETGLRDDDSHIYARNPALAVVHTHPTFAIALSFEEEEILPIDTEGIYYFKSIPVMSAALTVGSDEVEEMLPPLCENYKAAMVRGHGSFAVGQMLEEAFQWTSSLEASCKTLFLRRLLAPQGRREAAETW
jgi:L-fuculose-phosphate aldolase